MDIIIATQYNVVEDLKQKLITMIPRVLLEFPSSSPIPWIYIKSGYSLHQLLYL